MPVAESRYLTVSEVAREFAVSERTIRRLISRKELTIVRVGSAIRIPADALE